LRPDQLETVLRDVIPQAKLFGRLGIKRRRGVDFSGIIRNGFFSMRMGTNNSFIRTPLDLLNISGCIFKHIDGNGSIVGFVHVHPSLYLAYLFAGIVCLYYGAQGYSIQSALVFGVVSVLIFITRFLILHLFGDFLVDRLLCFFDSVFTYRLCLYTKKEPVWYFVFKAILSKTGLGIRRRGSKETVYPVLDPE